MTTEPNDDVLTPAEQKALQEEEANRQAQEDSLNDARAEQQMIEGAVDTDTSIRRVEQDRNRT